MQNPQGYLVIDIDQVPSLRIEIYVHYPPYAFVVRAGRLNVRFPDLNIDIICA